MPRWPRRPMRKVVLYLWRASHRKFWQGGPLPHLLRSASSALSIQHMSGRIGSLLSSSKHPIMSRNGVAEVALSSRMSTQHGIQSLKAFCRSSPARGLRSPAVSTCSRRCMVRISLGCKANAHRRIIIIRSRHGLRDRMRGCMAIMVGLRDESKHHMVMIRPGLRGKSKQCMARSSRGIRGRSRQGMGSMEAWQGRLSNLCMANMAARQSRLGMGHRISQALRSPTAGMQPIIEHPGVMEALELQAPWIPSMLWFCWCDVIVN
mmetsp:Transcript_8971/g.14908  ORF Transcript_8971/g.14908 Transcript_8971/m.14908 type:complete len:263 (-) Transcript_8971:96-884(-)